jgi:LemA protein
MAGEHACGDHRPDLRHGTKEQTMLANLPWIWIAAAATLAALYLWYATIVARANKVQEALASIDAHLRQRHDLVPNVVKLAGRFMEHERSLLEEVTRLRARADIALAAGPKALGELFAAENELARQMGRLFATAESYPTLKSDTAIVEAQRTWTEAEAQITAARRFYNAAVTALRNAVQIFPGRVLAMAAGVSVAPYFETPPETREAPSVDRLLPER